MSYTGVVDIHRKGVFTLSETNQILPFIKRFTCAYSKKVDALIARLEGLPDSQKDLMDSIEEEINALIRDWHIKVNKLGGDAKGLWLVDFDSGNGYFCWKYPEPKVAYWHKYEDGFSGRIPVEERPLVAVSSVQAYQATRIPAQ